MTPPLSRRQPLVDELLRRFGAALRGSQLYAPGHPLVTRNTAAFTEALLELLAGTPSLSIGLLADEVIVGDQPMPRGAAALGDLFGRLKSRGVERISFEKGVTAEELLTTVDALCRCLGAVAAEEVKALDLPHVHVGVLKTDKRAVARPADMAMVRTLHEQVTTTMRSVWGRAWQEGTVDASVASGVVDELAHVMSQNREALIALTAIRSSDDYTFTHMVNVAILTMMQAQGLGIDGPLLREFGVAGLMHDIGKVHTPPGHPEQAHQARSRRDGPRAPPPDRRRPDPAADDGAHAARRRRGLRAPPAPGRDRLPGRRQARRRSTWRRCCAPSPTSTTRCGPNGTTRTRSRPTGFSRSCGAARAGPSSTTWSGGSCS